MKCYRDGGCGPYEGRACNECPASKPDYQNSKSENEVADSLSLDKTLKGLACCNSEKMCRSGCPYSEECRDNAGENGYFYSAAIKDAIALLKAQDTEIKLLTEKYVELVVRMTETEEEEGWV